MSLDRSRSEQICLDRSSGWGFVLRSIPRGSLDRSGSRQWLAEQSEASAEQIEAVTGGAVTDGADQGPIKAEAVTGEQIEGIGAALWRRREVIFSGGCGYDLFGSFDVGMICLVSG